MTQQGVFPWTYTLQQSQSFGHVQACSFLLSIQHEQQGAITEKLGIATVVFNQRCAISNQLCRRVAVEAFKTTQ